MRIAQPRYDHEVLAEIAAMRAEFAELRQLIERALTIVPPRTWLTVEEAASLSNFSKQTIRAWCRLYRIGTCVRGEWRIVRSQLRAHIVVRFGLTRLPTELRDA